MIILVLNYVSCLPVILAVGVFSLYHLWAVLSNTTTIEGWEKEKARELRRKGRIQQVFIPSLCLSTFNADGFLS
jgi:palmitoyltransferase